MNKDGDLTYSEAIEEVMRHNGYFAPLKILYKEIWNYKDKSKIAGKTPDFTIQERVQRDARFTRILKNGKSLCESRKISIIFCRRVCSKTPTRWRTRRAFTPKSQSRCDNRISARFGKVLIEGRKTNMKIFFLAAALLFVFGGAADVFAQSGKITIILLRHAEKDTSASADRSDPDLTGEGRARAERLVETLKKYKPDLIYSTPFKRTKLTVLPLAERLDARYRIPIRVYDFNKLEELASRLLKTDARAVVVVGHNTTTPELANLLVKQEKYKALGDDEYDKIWIIEITRRRRKPNKIKAEVVKY